jgi:hypothetical protein
LAVPFLSLKQKILSILFKQQEIYPAQSHGSSYRAADNQGIRLRSLGHIIAAYLDSIGSGSRTIKGQTHYIIDPVKRGGIIRSPDIGPYIYSIK